MKVICIRCGSTSVRCTAMINPNTKEIKDLTSEAYLYGYCSDCDDPVLLSDVDEITTRMKQEYNNFIVTNKKEPKNPLLPNSQKGYMEQ